jgi:hypothetical protein
VSFYGPAAEPKDAGHPIYGGPRSSSLRVAMIE